MAIVLFMGKAYYSFNKTHHAHLRRHHMNINHVLVLTTDLRAMECFWVDLIGLHEGDRPPFPFNGLWLYSDDNPLIHIAEHPFSALVMVQLPMLLLKGLITTHYYNDLIIVLILIPKKLCQFQTSDSFLLLALMV